MGLHISLKENVKPTTRIFLMYPQTHSQKDYDSSQQNESLTTAYRRSLCSGFFLQLGMLLFRDILFYSPPVLDYKGHFLHKYENSRQRCGKYTFANNKEPQSSSRCLWTRTRRKAINRGSIAKLVHRQGLELEIETSYDFTKGHGPRPQTTMASIQNAK